MLERLRAGWPQVAAEVGRQRRMLGELTRRAQPAQLEGSTLVLAVKDALHREKLSDPVSKTVVADALRKVVGRAFALRPVLVEPGESAGEAGADDPLVSWAREDLGARVSKEEEEG